MSTTTQLKQRIKTLLQLKHERESLLTTIDYAKAVLGCTVPLWEQIRAEHEEIKQLGREAVFELMLHSSHRKFMKFLREHGEL